MHCDGGVARRTPPSKPWTARQQAATASSSEKRRRLKDVCQRCSEERRCLEGKPARSSFRKRFEVNLESKANGVLVCTSPAKLLRFCSFLILYRCPIAGPSASPRCFLICCQIKWETIATSAPWKIERPIGNAASALGVVAESPPIIVYETPASSRYQHRHSFQCAHGMAAESSLTLPHCQTTSTGAASGVVHGRELMLAAHRSPGDGLVGCRVLPRPPSASLRRREHEGGLELEDVGDCKAGQTKSTNNKKWQGK